MGILAQWGAYDQVCQEHNIRDFAIAFNAVPVDGEDIDLYDMLEVLRAEYVGGYDSL